jgi:hypothetical protein
VLEVIRVEFPCGKGDVWKHIVIEHNDFQLIAQLG